MLGENIAAFFGLYFRPVASISRILDQGKLWFAIVLTLVVSFIASAVDPAAFLMQSAARSMNDEVVQSYYPNAAPVPSPPVNPRTAFRNMYFFHSIFFSSVWSIAILLVPGMIAIRALMGYGSFGVLMRQDYLSMLMCTLLAWSAAYLPAAVGAWLIAMVRPESIGIILRLFGAAVLYFLFLAGLAARTAFGISGKFAAGLITAGAVLSIVGGGLFGILGISSLYVASPFFLFYAWRLYGSDVQSLGDGMRMRQHFRSQLEIATNNPRDADAHYQLGLIYQKRRQFTEAMARFARAVEIDPSEAEPHFQLGVIAKEQGRFDDAIAYLSKAAKLDDKLAQSDVWRELGAAYLGANKIPEAEAALEKYVSRREYDPEGLYWLGIVLKKTGRTDQAREMFRRSIDAVKTMPSHRRAQLRQWAGKSKAEM